MTRLLWLAAYAAVLLAAGWFDATQRRIPNPLVFWGSAVALAIASTASGAGLVTALGGVGFGLALGIPLYAYGFVGAGDAKLLATAGAFVGFPAVIPLALLAAVAGGALALAYGIARGQLRAAVSRIGSRSARPLASADQIPYAIAIAIAAAAQLAAGESFAWIRTL